MCLIVLAWRAHPRFPLIVAANRDEFHGRKAARAAFWRDEPQILGGRDLQAMGTWMAVSRTGRFAAVTNYRGAREATAAASRAASYSGFNLLATDRQELWWMSNRDGSPRRLEPGYYALGNLLLDSPEVQTYKQRMQEASPAVEPLFGILASAKIINPEYGTRCSTVLLDDGSQVRYSERSFGPDGAEGETAHFQFST